MATLDVIELFAGIGAQAQALDELNIDHRIVAISEIDPYAETSYRAIHDPKVNNLGDITKIESLPHCDLMTYSFPCTDISLAGNQAGLSKGSGTRSGLLWEVERLLEDYNNRQDLPKYLLLENVKNLVGKQFKADFDDWRLALELLGYTNYWKVLNAKNYGIPQNRERVIMLSIKNDNGGGRTRPTNGQRKYLLKPRSTICSKKRSMKSFISTKTNYSECLTAHTTKPHRDYNRKTGWTHCVREIGKTLNSYKWERLSEESGMLCTNRANEYIPKTG